jgi:protein-tyrosine phosphatase
MERISFVDCHSHVVPSGDDGAKSVDEGVALCRGAARHGTAILFATPHVWPYLTLTAEREQQVRAAFEEVRQRAGLDLRLGFELTPTEALLGGDPQRYVLPGTRHVLTEVPFLGPVSLLVALAEHVERCGLVPVVVHPERTESFLRDPTLAAKLAERGWPLQINGTSLLGRDGPDVQALAWSMVEGGHAALVASDGHRTTRPPHLDIAYAAVKERVGERASALFDGTALGLEPSSRLESSRAASRGA